MFLKRKSGYALLEVLISLFILSFLFVSGFHHQLKSIKSSAHEFERLSAINQARNLLERFRAAPLQREVEFERWQLENSALLPEMLSSYQCDSGHFCEVTLRCRQEEFKLSALVY